LQKDKIKWVEEKNIHLTVKFLGEIQEDRIPELSAILRENASLAYVFTFRFTGLGIFGSSYNPRIIWAGIYPYDKLIHLMQTVQRSFVKAGFPAERQKPVPHLTLGRIKFVWDKVLFQKTLDSFKQLESAPITAGEIVLFESILRPSGPAYIPLNEFPLKQENPRKANQGFRGIIF